MTTPATASVLFVCVRNSAESDDGGRAVRCRRGRDGHGVFGRDRPGTILNIQSVGALSELGVDQHGWAAEARG
jgi:hypothetical protein